MSLTTDWVKPARDRKGQDPLAVRAPCEKLYTQLLPGITNVTDRARYYSFHPWLVWAAEKHDGPLKRKSFVHTLRRAECLLTLVGAWHTEETGEELWRHGDKLVGRDKLVPALETLREGKSLKLSAYASTEEDASNRYFKNTLGGLGQYYLGTLRDLGLLDGDARSGVRYTRQVGGPLAEAFDAKVDRKRFFDALERDRVDLETVKSLRRFCPCSLRSNAAEQAALVDLFFEREGQYGGDDERHRWKTLSLMLDLASRIEAGGYDFSVRVFRACAYAGALPSGEPWEVAPILGPLLEGWKLYQRNELLSIAVQGVFWAGLDELRRQGITLANSEEYRAWFVADLPNRGGGFDPDESFESAVVRTIGALPSLERWTDEAHEVRLGWDVADLWRSFDPGSRNRGVLRRSLDILLALAARGEVGERPYGGFIESATYLESYSINLESFRRHLRQTWAGMSVGEFLGWVATEWGVNTHFKVALRKLRSEKLDTFQIKPTERGLVVVDAPQPVFSNPRLEQAMRILKDLGALDVDADTGRVLVTTLGLKLLEEGRRE